MKMKLIKPGKFLMGSPKDEEGHFDDEGPQHEVEITRPFYMGVYPVTKGQFAAFVKDDGYQTEAEKDGKGGFSCSTTTAKWERKPVYLAESGFSQEDDTGDGDDLERREALLRVVEPEGGEDLRAADGGGVGVRLPGRDDDGLLVRRRGRRLRTSANMDAWYKGKWIPKPRRTGRLSPGTTAMRSHRRWAEKANPWGLYDMHGNVWQWCADGYGPYQEGYIKDPNSEDSATPRVLRGGSWYHDPRNCRSAGRNVNVPAGRGDNDGFRVVLRLSAGTP